MNVNSFAFQGIGTNRGHKILLFPLDFRDPIHIQSIFTQTFQRLALGNGQGALLLMN